MGSNRHSRNMSCEALQNTSLIVHSREATYVHTQSPPRSRKHPTAPQVSIPYTVGSDAGAREGLELEGLHVVRGEAELGQRVVLGVAAGRAADEDMQWPVRPQHGVVGLSCPNSLGIDSRFVVDSRHTRVAVSSDRFGSHDRSSARTRATRLRVGFPEHSPIVTSREREREPRDPVSKP